MKIRIIIDDTIVTQLPVFDEDEWGKLIKFKVLNNDDTNFDLTGKTVYFMAKILNDFNEYLFIRTCTITDAAAGECEYTLQGGDLSGYGVFQAFVRVFDINLSEILSIGDLTVNKVAGKVPGSTIIAQTTDNISEGITNLFWDYDADGNKIINVGTPTANTDATNKSYVDDKITANLGNSAPISHTHTISDITDLGTAGDKDVGTNEGEIPILGVGGKLNTSVLPNLSLTSVSVVADITARDALTVEEGDVAKVTDIGDGTSKTYIYGGSAWIELSAGTQNLNKEDILDFVETDYVHVTGNETIAGEKTFSNVATFNGDLKTDTIENQQTGNNKFKLKSDYTTGSNAVSLQTENASSTLTDRVIVSGGSNTGEVDIINATLDMNSSKITSVADPTVTQDAANKGYVDTQISGLDYYTQSEVDTEVTNSKNSIIDGAPTDLNTLNKLAAALGDDADFATNNTIALGNKADSSTVTTHTSSTSNPHSVTATQIGLGNVDNTSDANKPISTATQTALDAKADSSHTHIESDITDLDKYTQAEANALLAAKANDNAVVHLTGNETISSIKEFSGTIRATGQSTPSSGLGMELRYLSGRSSILSYDRDLDVYKPFEIKANQIYFNIDNTDVADINSSGFILDNGVRVNEFSSDDTLGGNSNTALPTERAVKTYVDTAVSPKADSSTVTAHTSSTSNPHSVTATQVGLGNVDNTSDANKPISTATQTALDLKAADNAVVHLTGAETIAGLKQFNDGISFDNDGEIISSTGTGIITIAARGTVKIEGDTDGNDPSGSSNILFTINGNNEMAIYNDGRIGVGNNRITSLATPTSGTDATTKTYVDSAVSPKADSSTVTTHTSSTSNPHSVTLEQARTAGSTLSGDINAGSNKITSLATPTADTDAATKGYVDSVAQGLDWQKSVLDQDLSTPPGSPTTGDRYIVNPTGTGAWATHDNKITEYNGSSWDFTALANGQTVYVDDESKYFRWNNSEWVEFISGTDHGELTGLGDDDHTQYHTDARALTWIGTRDTSDLSEGSNLYFTNERVDDRVNALMTDTTNITWTYNDGSNTLEANVGTITESQISDLQNYALNSNTVHLTSTESISGVKTFSSTVTIDTGSDDSLILDSAVGQNVMQRFKQDTTEVGSVFYYNASSSMYLRGGSGKSVGLNVNNSVVPSLSINTSGLVSLTNGTGINEFSIDGTLAGNSDDAVPTEKAVKTYVDTQISTTDATTVHTTGTESIGGQKTFTNSEIRVENAGNAAIRLEETTPGNEWRINAEQDSLLTIQQFDGSGTFEKNHVEFNRDGVTEFFQNLDLKNNNLVNVGTISSTDVVHTSGAETIAGLKQFNDGISFDDAGENIISSATGILNLNSRGDIIFEADTNGNDASGSANFLFKINGTNELAVYNDGRIGFNNNNLENVGTIGSTDVVHTSGNETIAGVKTFSNSSSTDVILNTALSNNNSITFQENTDNQFRLLHDGSGSSTNNLFKIQSADGADGVIDVDAIVIDQSGKVNLTNGTSINEFSIDGTLAGNSDDAVPTEKAVKTYVDSSSTVVHTSGNETVAGEKTFTSNVEVNNTAPSYIFNESDTSNKWRIIMGGSSLFFDFNTGTDFSTYTRSLEFDTAGKVKLDLGTGINEFSTDATLSGNSDDAVPTEKAVKTYVDTANSGFVSNTGSESIAGIKTFTGSEIKVQNAGSAGVRLEETTADNEWKINAENNTLLTIQQYDGTGTFEKNHIEFNRGGNTEIFQDVDLKNNDLINVGTIGSTDVVHTSGDETISGVKTFSGTIQATGQSTPSGGVGLEIRYTSGRGSVLAYNRDTTSYIPYEVKGSELYFNINNSDIVDISSSGMMFTGSGVRINEFSTDATLSGNSDDAVPTEKAVKTYVDNWDGGSF